MMAEACEDEEDLPYMGEYFEGLIGRNLLQDLSLSIDWKIGKIKLKWKKWST